MAKHELKERHIFDALDRRLRNLSRRMKHLESSGSTTLPIYDKTALPPLVDNSVFWGTDNTLNVYRNGIVYSFTPS